MKSTRYILWLLWVLVCLFLLVPSKGQTDPLDTWTARVSRTSNDLLGITYGNGVFVAVGTKGTIVTSTDGISWTLQNSGTTVDTALLGVAYF